MDIDKRTEELRQIEEEITWVKATIKQCEEGRLGGGDFRQGMLRKLNESLGLLYGLRDKYK